MKKIAPIDKVCSWANKSGLTSFCVLSRDGLEHAATINFKRDSRIDRVYVIAFEIIEKRKVSFEGKAGGGGYDKHTAALEGFSIRNFAIKNGMSDWQHQLNKAGFTVIQTL